jgi:hypothetical protein
MARLVLLPGFQKTIHKDCEKTQISQLSEYPQE